MVLVAPFVLIVLVLRLALNVLFLICAIFDVAFVARYLFFLSCFL